MMGELSNQQKSYLLTFIEEDWASFVNHVAEYEDLAGSKAEVEAVKVMAALEYEIDCGDE